MYDVTLMKHSQDWRFESSVVHLYCLEWMNVPSLCASLCARQPLGAPTHHHRCIRWSPVRCASISHPIWLWTFISSESLGQIVKKPQGLSGKSSPGGESAPLGLPSENLEAFRLPRGGTFSWYHPRLFHNLSDFGFLGVQGHSSLGINLKKSWKTRSAICTL